MARILFIFYNALDVSKYIKKFRIIVRINTHITIHRTGKSIATFDGHLIFCIENKKQKLFFEILNFIKTPTNRVRILL